MAFTLIRSVGRLVGDLYGPSPTPAKKKSPLQVAEAYLGRHERDSDDAYVLSEFFKNAAGLKLNPRDTAWCAAFVNAVVATAGEDSTNSLMARSFENWGLPVDEPIPGDVVVFWRVSRSSGLGHVGFFVKDNGDGTIQVLGGNQGDKVSIQRFSKAQVTAYRRGKGQITDHHELQEWEEPDDISEVESAS